MITAHQAGLIVCHFCHNVNRLDEAQQQQLHTRNQALHCYVCDSIIHSRIPNSVSKTWALMIAAIILYIPANTQAIMTIKLWGNGHPETIMSGVISLLDGGMWPLALLIFVASIFIPIAKLIILLYLLLSIHYRSQWRPKERTQLYRVIEWVGRWSMIDIFVIGILVALVQFGNAANVAPGIGALSFAAVVICTMMATHSFDPRLIWDVIEEPTHD